MEHGQSEEGPIDLSALGADADQVAHEQLIGARPADADGVVDHGGMGGRRTATDNEKEQIEQAEQKDVSVGGMEIVGDDEGAERVLCHMILDPRLKPNRIKIRNLTKEQIKAQIQEALEKHCMQIGWWPDGEGPDFVVAQRTDGVWHGYAKLRKSLTNPGKSWGDFPRVKVDGRTSEDVAKGA